MRYYAFGLKMRNFKYTFKMQSKYMCNGKKINATTQKKRNESESCIVTQITNENRVRNMRKTSMPDLNCTLK